MTKKRGSYRAPLFLVSENNDIMKCIERMGGSYDRFLD